MTYSRLIAFAALLLPAASYGQSREPFETSSAGPLLRADVAGSRQPAGLEPAGVHAGTVLVQPSLSVRAEADSNVLNRSSSKRGDIYVVFAPAVKASGEAGRAGYVVQAEAAAARFAKLTSQNSETFGLDGSVRFDVTRNAALFTRVSFDRKVEPHSSAGAASVEGSPAEYDQVEAQIAARMETGSSRFTASVTATELTYADITQTDGTIADQGFRDTSTLSLALKAEHAVPAGATLFVQGKYNWIDSTHPDPCCDRSSKGGQALAGIRADLGKLITAEFAAGYVFRNYDSPGYSDYGGLTWRARADWYATPLMSLSLAGGRSIVNSGIREVPAIIVDTASVQMFYEVRRNLNLVLTLARTDEDYREASTQAHTNLIGLESRYIFSSRYAGGAYARYRDRKSSGGGQLRDGSAIESGLWLRVGI